jgi:hypothetical protein
MSGYKLHLLSYLALSGAVFYLIKTFLYVDLFDEIGLAGIAIGGIYSLLPDVDSPTSKMRHAVTISLSVAALLLLAYGFLSKRGDIAYLSIITIAAIFLILMTRHRGALHSPVAGILFSAPFLLIGPLYFAMALWGYLSHLLLDGVLFR